MASLKGVGGRLASWINRTGLRIALACLPPVECCDEALLSILVPPSAGAGFSSEVGELVAIAMGAASAAGKIDLRDVSDRMRDDEPRWPNMWPGEHYKLLAALIAHLQPKTVIEIGTFLGLSALAMKKNLPAAGRIVTFDLHPWESFPTTCLRVEDFADGRLRQVLGNLALPAVFAEHAALLAQADLIFLDGPKNRVFERAFLRRLADIRFNGPVLLVIDDIRLWSMLDIWREIPFPKLDVTSFGHFTGTGFVRLTPK